MSSGLLTVRSFDIVLLSWRGWGFDAGKKLCIGDRRAGELAVRLSWFGLRPRPSAFGGRPAGFTGAKDVLGNNEYLLVAGDFVVADVANGRGGIKGVSGSELDWGRPSSVLLVVGRLSSKDLKLSKVLLLLTRRDDERVAAGRLRNITL